MMKRLMAFWSTIRYYSGFDSGEIHCEILLDPIETGLGSLKKNLGPQNMGVEGRNRGAFNFTPPVQNKIEDR